ncbi:MAG TPA: hypothetical protein VGC57_07075 [Cellulomonas sp.]
MIDASSRRPDDERDPMPPVSQETPQTAVPAVGGIGSAADPVAPLPARPDAPDAPEESAEEPGAGEDHEPTEQEIAAEAGDAYVRRAPKIGAFITAGVLLGALAGLVAALIAGPDSPIGPDGTAFISVLEGQGSVRLIMAVSGAVVGALVGAGLAVLADRRSVRGRPEVPPAPRPSRRRPKA